MFTIGCGVVDKFWRSPISFEHVSLWFLIVMRGYSSARMGTSLASDVVMTDGKKYALHA